MRNLCCGNEFICIIIKTHFHNKGSALSLVLKVELLELGNGLLVSLSTFCHICSELAPSLPLEVDPDTYDSPHTKAHLLFQAHFSRTPLPSTDYLTDLNSVLDQAIRILQVRQRNRDRCMVFLRWAARALI